MLNKTALSLQTQCGRRWCIQQHSPAWGGAEGRRSTGPFPAGTSIPRLLSPDLVGECSVFWGNPPGQAWGQHLGLGCDPGKDNRPRLGIVDGASLEGSDVIFPTPPLLPQHHPVFCYLFQSIISITIIIFLPCLPSQHQPRFSVHKGDSANTKGEMSARCIPCFSPNVMWGYRISHHITAACSAMATDLSQLLLQTLPSRRPFAMDTSHTWCKDFSIQKIRFWAAPGAWQLVGMLEKETEEAAPVRKRRTLSAKKIICHERNTF